MHQDPWEPLDGSYPSDRKPDSEPSDPDQPVDGEVTRLSSSVSPVSPAVPSPFLNWQVVEIDGEATLIEESEVIEIAPESISVSPPALPLEVAPPSGGRTSSIREQYDEIVAAAMQTRRLTVMPGETAAFEVTIANHGRWAALFEVTVEGWINEAWTPDLPLRVQLEPGARQMVMINVALPRQADCPAGEHALAVVVRAARYPGHWSRLAATLVVERFAALKLGMPQPRELALSWFVATATTRVPITNQSNYPATVHLHGVDGDRQADFTFYTDGAYTAGTYTAGSDLDDGVMGTAHLTLQPGQTVAVPVEVRTRLRPLIGLTSRTTPFRLIARVDTEPPLRRSVDGQLAVAALIGPWQLALGALLGVMAIFGIGLAGLALLVALRPLGPANVAAAPVATAAPAQPIVSFVIQMDQPMPTRAVEAPVTSAPAQSQPQSVANTVSAASDIPIVSADQVTAPGEPTPVGQRPLRPLVVTTPPAQVAAAPQGESAPAQAAPAAAGNANLTYGQMFKEVASQYDLDWRLLAAQAYLESGFDSLALSDDGYMGLMQIDPNTWNEFAPTVNASDPFDSYSNVLVGAVYLDYLRKQLSARGLSQTEWMLVAFNWGPEKVFSHVAAGGTWESLDPARRQYAEDILRIAATIPES